jgi:predicted porin
MKKTLVALAALASISAFAQSSVTLYGGLDTGIVKQKSDDGTSTVNRSYTGGNAGYTSRIGVKGEEDLGGGSKATFNWEAALGTFGADATNNAAFSNSAVNSTRTAQISLTNASKGTFTAGYGMNARHVMAATVAQNDFSLPGNIALGASSGGNGTNLGTTGGGLSNQDYSLRSNSVSYTTPSFGGLNLVVGSVLANNSTTTDTTGVATANTNQNAKVIGGIYANGPLSLMASTTKTIADAAVGATTSSTKTNNIIGGLYDLGVAKVGFAHYQDKLATDNSTVLNVNNRGNVFTVRGVVSGPWEAFALYAKGKYENTAAAATAGDRAQSGYQLAAYYNFSKRTAAYLAQGVQKRDNAVLNGAQTKDTATTIGLRHNF